jgi:hypothetical protein
MTPTNQKMFFFQLFIYISPVVEAVGTGGKPGAFLVEGFPSPVETAGKSVFDFSAVSMGRQFPQLLVPFCLPRQVCFCLHPSG